jgi:uncharacterized protein (DUF983 family)
MPTMKSAQTGAPGAIEVTGLERPIFGPKDVLLRARACSICGTDVGYKHPDDKPTIGLLLCESKNNVVAEYALRGYTAPIGLAEWTTAITTALPEEFTGSLPTIAELEVELAAGAG